MCVCEREREKKDILTEKEIKIYEREIDRKKDREGDRERRRERRSEGRRDKKEIEV